MNCDCGALPTGSKDKEIFPKTQLEAKSTGRYMVLYPGLRYANGGERPEEITAGENTAATATFTNRKGVSQMVWLEGAAATKVEKVEWGRRTDTTPRLLPSTPTTLTMAPGDNVKWTFTESALYKVKSIPVWP